MKGNYSNNLRVPITANPGGAITGFTPQVDLFGNGHSKFGPLLVGNSVPYANVQPVVGNNDGAVLTVKHDPNGGANLESRTLYLVNPPDKAFQLPNGGTLRLEADFDMPENPGGVPPGNPPTAVDIQNYAWAVGIALKSGDQYEATSDKLLSITCQFINTGQVNFHFTNFAANPVNTSVYADYLHHPPTKFRLVMEITREITNAGVVVTGTGLLKIDAKEFGPASIKALGPPPATFPDINFATAAGVSLVSKSNILPQISARIQSFTLQITP